MANYSFEVRTGNKFNATTYSGIFVRLTGDFGDSEERKLNDFKGGSFKRNSTDRFTVPYGRNCGNIYRIVLRSDRKALIANWYCEYIKINQSIFRFDQWINDKNPITRDASNYTPLARSFVCSRIWKPQDRHTCICHEPNNAVRTFPFVPGRAGI